MNILFRYLNENETRWAPAQNLTCNAYELIHCRDFSQQRLMNARVLIVNRERQQLAVDIFTPALIFRDAILRPVPSWRFQPQCVPLQVTSYYSLFKPAHQHAINNPPSGFPYDEIREVTSGYAARLLKLIKERCSITLVHLQP